MLRKLILCLCSFAIFTSMQSLGADALILCRNDRSSVGHAEPRTYTSWGSWGRQAMCPHGHYIYGFQLKVEPEQDTFGDNTAANGVRVFCGCPGNRATRTIPRPNSRIRGGYTWIESNTERFGSWTAPRYCPCNSFIKGLEVRSEPDQDAGDDTAVNNVNMVCENSTTHKLLGSGMPWGSWNSAHCPGNSLACGIQTRVEKAGAMDDTALNKVKLICCSPPSARQPTAHITGQCNQEKFPDPMRWVPTYHFHKFNRCYPDVAHSRNNNKCRGFNPNAPVYWHGEKCGDNMYKLQYWLWYGKQTACYVPGSLGVHDNDWEYVNVNFLRCGSEYCVDSVTYGQHKGWYTRMLEYNSDDVRPTVYVGHIAHGNFHNSNRPNIDLPVDPSIFAPIPTTCMYYADFRGSKHRWTPTNLRPLSDFNGSTDAVEKWATELNRRKIICSIKSCRGTGLEISGCEENNYPIGGN